MSPLQINLKLGENITIDKVFSIKTQGRKTIETKNE